MEYEIDMDITVYKMNITSEDITVYKVNTQSDTIISSKIQTSLHRQEK